MSNLKLRSVAALLLVLCLSMSQLALADTVTPEGNAYGFAGTNGKYYTDYASFEDEQMAARELAIEAASEGFTLLKNENNALPPEERRLRQPLWYARCVPGSFHRGLCRWIYRSERPQGKHPDRRHDAGWVQGQYQTD